MTIRKRNEWLETGASDDEDEQGYNSEEQEDSRGALAGRSQKRRRVEQDDDSDNDSIDEDEDDVPSKAVVSKSSRFSLHDEDQDEEAPSDHEDEDAEEQNNEEDQDTSAATISKKSKDSKLKPLSAKQLEKSEKAAKKTGVIYLSRIPPFMKPAALKHLLSPYGEIGRVFLTPEDPTAHQRRVRAGGNKKKSFSDGWVEFVNKKDAKIVAESLNGNIVGGKKGSFYHDDVWNMKYLKGFKWHHLTDQIANENAERAARLRAEISKTRRENKKFVEDIERAKMLETMASKKMARLEKEGGAGAEKSAASVKADTGRKMQFKQNQVKLKRAKDGASAEQPGVVQRVVKSIF